MDKVILVSIDNIVPNKYQRAEFRNEEKVAEIVESLKLNRGNGTKGMLQIPTARLVDGVHELAFGHHRLYAFQCLAAQDPFFSEMPLIVRDLSDQEMFEAMATENLRRRDISAIEEAEMLHTYMETFNKDSVQTGAFFQKTDEYIRGRIFLLNLPEAAKEQMKEGKINVSTARSLISLNKIGGSEAVNKALEKISKNGHESPQEAVEDVLRNSPNMTWLDKSAPWFSANKNFPRKHLSKLTKEQIMEVLGIPTGLANDAVYWEIKNFMVEYPILHANLIPESFPALHEYDPGFERLKVLLNPPACEKCPFHTSLDGDHYCGIPLDRDRKVEAWHRKELEDVSHSLGIPLYQKSDGRMVELISWNDADRKLFNAGGADLRLAPANHMWNNFEGVGRELKVVLVGPAAEKRLKASEDADKKRSAEEMSRKNEMHFRDTKEQFEFRFTWEVASHAFVSALDGLSAPVVDFLLTDMLQYVVDDTQFPEGSDDHDELIELARKMKKADGVKQIRRIMVYDMLFIKVLEHFDTTGTKKNIVELAKHIQKVAEEWGVKLPKDWTKQVEKYQAELDQALKDIKASAKVKA
jgi:ParB/RepB/Spo0J family partition protein